MDILLINTNPVVSRLMWLCCKEQNILLDEVSSLDNAAKHFYDIIFIDDMMYHTIVNENLQKIERSKLILFSAKKELDQPSEVDDVIYKPFLPSKILEVFETVEKCNTDTSALSIHQEPSEAMPKQPQEEKNDNILNLDEIEKIKFLLDENDADTEDISDWEDEDAFETRKREVIKQNLIDEGLEIVEEDLLSAIEPDLQLHITHNQYAPWDKNFEKELLNAVQNMKLKKLKKLLKGAQITVNIDFKDNHA